MDNNHAKAANRIALNTRLLAVLITVFFLTINLKKELLMQKILAVQFILPIPLLVTSILAYSKVSYREKIARWDKLGFITFILGYAFLSNVIGILIGNIIGKTVALIFFAATWIFALIYSAVDISYDKSVMKERLIKDGAFILIQLIFGVLVVLGVIF